MERQVAYRIAVQSEVEAAEAQGHYAGTGLDLKDGFLHMSTVESLSGTLSKYFAQCPQELVILEVELSHPLLSSEGRYIQWEEVATRNNMEFPHLYGGPLPWECISRIHSVPRDDEGCPQLPEELLALCKGRD